MAIKLNEYAHYLRGLATGTFRGLDLNLRVDTTSVVDVEVEDATDTITLRSLIAPPLVITRRQIEDNEAERLVLAHFMALHYFRQVVDAGLFASFPGFLIDKKKEAHPVITAVNAMKRG